MLDVGVIVSDRYEIVGCVGSGGMADVYKAKDCMLNRYVAVKVLKKEYREDENFVKKFRSEAQAAAGLLNPNIVNVYDVGNDGNIHYIVMEYIDGFTLKELISSKAPFTDEEAVGIGLQIGAALEHAHKKR